MNKKLKDMALNSLNRVSTSKTVAKKENYDFNFIVKTMESFKNGGKILGAAVNGIIAMQSAGIDSNKVKRVMSKNIDLESIIDSSVQGKPTVESQNAIEAIKNMLIECSKQGVEFPEQMEHRIYKDLKKENAFVFTTEASLSILYSYMMNLVDSMDKRILGEGSEKIDRVKGLIDQVIVDAKPFAAYHSDMPGWLSTKAISLRGEYGRKVRDLMKETEEMKIVERTEARKEVQQFQQELLHKLNALKTSEIKLIVSKWAADIYVNGSVHDSILFIDSIGLADGTILRGTFEFFIELLQDIGLAKRTDIASTTAELLAVQLNARKRVEKAIKTKDVDTTDIRKQIRVWRPKADGDVTTNMFTINEEIIIDKNSVLVGDVIFKLGDRTPASSGTYRIIEINEITGKDGKTVTTGVNLLIDEVK